MIKVDLHVHSKLSKRLPFSLTYFQDMIDQGKRESLSGFALTEHFHSYDYWDSMRKVARRYPYQNGALVLRGGFTVLTGAEITVGDGADIIAIGSLEEIEELDGMFYPRISDGNHPCLADVLDVCVRKKIIFIGAHPTRPLKRLVDMDYKLLNDLDAMEINGRDVAEGVADGNIKKLADSLNLPVTSGSDAHIPAQVGVQYSLLPVDELSQESLRYALASGKIQNHSRLDIKDVVKACLAKKMAEMDRLFPGRVRRAPPSSLLQAAQCDIAS